MTYTKEILRERFDKEKKSLVFDTYYDKGVTVDYLLVGVHDSETNALVISDYPYGFRLRTDIRYWIETTNRGDRFVSQTLNPKNGKWNAPKKSVYADVMVMIGNDEGHITYLNLSFNDKENKAMAFLNAFKEQLTELQIKRIHKVSGWDKAMQSVSFSVVNTTDWTQEQRDQHDKEQREKRDYISRLAAHHANKSYKGGEE